MMMISFNNNNNNLMFSLISYWYNNNKNKLIVSIIKLMNNSSIFSLFSYSSSFSIFHSHSCTVPASCTQHMMNRRENLLGVKTLCWRLSSDRMCMRPASFFCCAAARFPSLIPCLFASETGRTRHHRRAARGIQKLFFFSRVLVSVFRVCLVITS